MRELVKGERGRVYALFAIVMLASAFGNLSQTAVNAMMPEIMGEFALDVSLGQWLTTSYMLVLGIAVPAATFLGKRFTTRQHVFIALAFFLVGPLPTAWPRISPCCWPGASARPCPRGFCFRSCRLSP